jgi:type IV pilus assembly protein PilE
MTIQNMTRYRSTHSANPRIAKGFTLVEVVIVVLIISVLAAIAYPAYQDSVVKARRAAARSCLLESESFMQRFYTTNLRYDQSLAGVAVALPACAAGADVTNHYTVALTAVAVRAYTLTATPRGLQLAKDTQCGTLSIDNLGNKTKAGTESLDYCW